MSIISVMEQTEARLILKYLAKSSLSASELDEQFRLESKKITTSTLYRRLKELQLLELILKGDNKKYSITPAGKDAMKEVNEVVQQVGSNTFSQKIFIILQVFVSGPKAYLDLISQFSYSPNEIKKILNELENDGFIKKSEEDQFIETRIKSVKKKRSPGRPKIYYEITNKGLTIFQTQTQAYEKLRSKKR